MNAPSTRREPTIKRRATSNPLADIDEHERDDEDVLSNPKVTFRLQASCEKLKKILSANSKTPLNAESIMNDIDASSKLTREEYESLIADVLERIPAPIQAALD
jgi:molecular chaperone DnaK (HSP70)